MTNPADLADLAPPDPTKARDARNARRRERARARALARHEELEIIGVLARQLEAAGEDAGRLLFATITEGGAVLVGAPEDTVEVLVAGDDQGWHSTQYQSADFACRPHRAARAISSEWEIGSVIEEVATWDQRRRAIARALR